MFNVENAGWVSSYLGLVTLTGALVGLMCGIYGIFFDGIRIIMSYGISFEALLAYCIMIFFSVPIIFLSTALGALLPFCLLLMSLYFGKLYRSCKR